MDGRGYLGPARRRDARRLHAKLTTTTDDGSSSAMSDGLTAIVCRVKRSQNVGQVDAAATSDTSAKWMSARCYLRTTTARASYDDSLVADFERQRYTVHNLTPNCDQLSSYTHEYLADNSRHDRDNRAHADLPTDDMQI